MTAPTTPAVRGSGRLVATLVGAAAGWAGLFALNEVAWDVALGDWLGLDLSHRVVDSVGFFVYDVVKILLLLVGMIFVVGMLRTTLRPERVRTFLEGRPLWLSLGMAAVLGAVTPFCSCSSIPLFIGFTSSGLPLAVTFSFLISSPLVDLASMILLASIFNWSIALAYVVVGIVLAVVGGTLIGKARMEQYVEAFVTQQKVLELPQDQLTLGDRLSYAREQVGEIIRKVWLYILIGVGIGAAIHNWIPQDLIIALLGSDNWWSVPLATLVGAPMYADIFGTLPIAESLVAKGVGLGTVLAFMMAVTALSLPSLIMLKKVVKAPLLILFLAIVVSGIMLIGYLFNTFTHLFL